MKPKHTKILPKIIMVYLVGLILVTVYASMYQLIFRQYIRITGGILAIAGLMYLGLQAVNRLPEGRRKTRTLLSIGVVLLAGAALALGILTETDRETVTIREGQKKIRRESSFIMFYEVTYYDYGNLLWYRAYPCIRESYDDGDPGQWVYTDYYDEDGKLIERVNKEE